jgi:hypothetical protein
MSTPQLEGAWPQFPGDLRAMLQSAVASLRALFWIVEADYLAKGRLVLGTPERDSWNGDTLVWPIRAELTPEGFADLNASPDGQNARNAIEHTVQQTVQDRFDGHRLGNVTIVPRLDVLTGGKPNGINNQGRAHPNNPAALPHDGCHFRARTETYFHDALKGVDVLFAPLPVFVKANALRRRVELDFLIIKDGITLIVEIDGGSHTERPVDAQDRLIAFEQEGCHVFRVDAADCANLIQAAKMVKRILEHISQLKFSRL